MYKIGEFSKIVDLPVRTLRYYDEYGILIPNEIDNFTGYRYYDDENISECKLIKLLKSLDFTLEEIAEYKNCLDEYIVLKKKEEIKERINLLKIKYDRLTAMQEIVKSKDNNFNTIQESNEEKILRRKYEKRNIRQIV